MYPGWPWWGYPYPYPYGYPPGPWRVHADWATATLRIELSPSDAEVYVDRFYAGPVDHFDGIFQHLTLHAGPHFIEIRKTGFRILVFEVNLYPGESMTYRQTMTPATEGDRDVPAPAAPGFEEGAALPSPFDVAAAPGEVRFDVTPRDAAIYADGFYAGLVSDFDDTQHLLLPSGRHHVSFTLDGYESLDVDLSVESARTMTYRGSLKKSK